MIWGVDIPCDDDEFWLRVKRSTLFMARKEKIEINYIKTNLHEFINEAILDICFRRYLNSSWWTSIQFAVSTAGLTAPLTVVKSIGTLLMASGITSDYKDFTNVDYHKTPGRTSNYIHGNLGWADIITLYDGIELTRQKKIREILKQELTRKEHNFMLRVCGFPYFWVTKNGDINCNNCEKCWRTIVGLVLEGIDPNQCGFRINNNFFPTLKHQLLYNRNRFMNSDHTLFMWQDIQQYIPKEMNQNHLSYLYNSNNFFYWFRNFALSKSEIKHNAISNITLYLIHLYSHFPKNIHLILLKFQKKFVKLLKLTNYL